MQGEMSGNEKKVNENTCDISPKKRVTKKFLEVSRCSRAKTTGKKCTKQDAVGAYVWKWLYYAYVKFFICMRDMWVVQWYCVFEGFC